jgi:hypothetical protein
MRLGLRLLFVVCVIQGIAAFFVLRVFGQEIKPSVREVMEEQLVDAANVLAELAAPELLAGTLANGSFAQAVAAYQARDIKADIWGLKKTSADFRVYVMRKAAWPTTRSARPWDKTSPAGATWRSPCGAAMAHAPARAPKAARQG